MIKDAFYFPHDSNARRDPSIVKLRLGYGWATVAMYWSLIEILREQSDFALKAKDAAAYISDDFKIDLKAAKDLILTLKECCLIRETDEGYLVSDSLIRRMQEINEKSKRGKALAGFRWDKEGEHADRNAGRNAKKEKKKKTNKEKKKERDARPEDQKEVARYMLLLRSDLGKNPIWEQANLWWDHQLECEWKRGKARIPMADWRASVRTWMMNAVKFGDLLPKKSAPQVWICPGCKKEIPPGEKQMHLDNCEKLSSMPLGLAEKLDELTAQMHVEAQKGERKR